MNRDVITVNLVNAVKKMRREQKMYFQTKQHIHLIRAKELEAEVDQRIIDFDRNIHPNQNQNKLL